jgi:YheC/D like ATP-grasp
MMQSVRVILDRVRIGATDQWVIRVRPKYFKTLSPQKNRQILAKFGTNGKPSHWFVTVRKMNQTLFSIPLRLIKTDQGWVLGPVIGILTSIRGQTFGGNRFDHRDLSKVGRHTHTCVYVLTPGTVDTETGKVEGYVWTGKKMNPWVKVPMPIPDLVYNRIPNRAREADLITQKTKQWLMQRNGGHLYNSRFFNKIELLQYLSASQETRDFLPNTEVFKSRDQLVSWLKVRDVIYVKPANGTIGQGIFRVERLGNGWMVKRQQKKEQKVKSFQQLPFVVNHISQSITSGRYIIQEGIHLAKWNGRMFDLRVLLQKNRKHHWKLTGLGARVAGIEKITTHVPNGGMIADAKQVLKDVFQQRAEEIFKDIKHLTITSANQIERFIPQLAEMSMDIGVDEFGRPWFIEANAKPMKFDEPIIRTRSLLRIVHFAEGLYT